MRVHALTDEGLGNASYLVEVGRRLAAVVDAPRDVRPHLRLADEHGLRIVAALDTHLHADFVGGARELADATRAEIIAPRGGRLGYPHRDVSDGELLELGDTPVRALATPGHTPEHVSYLVGGTVLFSGGSIISGGAARTDLVDPALTEDLARAQFRSFRRLAELPDATMVHPTHGAGSFCSTTLAGGPAATLGDQRATNPLLAMTDEESFVRALLGGYGSFPPYFLRLREVNRRGPVLLRELPDVPVLPPVAVRDAMSDGTWLVDARDVREWAAGHPSGAVSISLRGAFVTWLGWVVPFGDPIVLLTDPGDRGRAVREARRIGYDRILGFLDGVEAWAEAGLPVLSAEEVEPQTAAERGWPMVDVRQPSEHAASRIAGALHLPLGDLISGRLPDHSEVVVYCGHGERSATAASLLERAGVRAATLAGGLPAWERAGLPVRR